MQWYICQWSLKSALSFSLDFIFSCVVSISCSRLWCDFYSIAVVLSLPLNLPSSVTNELLIRAYKSCHLTRGGSPPLITSFFLRMTVVRTNRQHTRLFSWQCLTEVYCLQNPGSKQQRKVSSMMCSDRLSWTHLCWQSCYGEQKDSHTTLFGCFSAVVIQSAGTNLLA